MTIAILRIRYLWARLTRNDIAALLTMKEIVMADFTAFDAALDRVTAKVAADEDALATAHTALATAQSDAAGLQAEIDARAGKLAAVAPA
jgi:hypothetical protein